MNAAIYARYSTDRQSETSIEDQTRRCREYAARMGYEVSPEHVYSDAAISGTHTERPGLQRMLKEMRSARRSPFRVVIVESQSRLTRDDFDAKQLIYRDLPRAGVKLLDTSGFDSTSDSGEMQSAMNGIVDAQYVKGISKMTHRGLDGRARSGFSTGGSLYGYRTIAEPGANPEFARHLWEINTNESEIVRRIFTLVEFGESYRAIADVFNREGVEPPRNNGRGGKHGGGWSHVSVRAIVMNEKYVGRWVWNATKWVRLPGERKRRRLTRPETEHVTREMPELAIVERATWDRVHSRIARRKHGDERTTRQGQQTYLVSGLLRCGLCSGPMSVRSAKVKAGRRYVNYGCTAHSSRGGSICSNSETISERKISQALIGALREILTGPDVAAAFSNAFARRVAESNRGDSAADLERLLASAQKRVTNATRLLIEDPDDREVRELREASRVEVRRIETEISSQSPRTSRALPDPATLRAAMSGFLESLLQTAPELGRAALVRCVSPLTVTPKREGPGHRFQVTGSVDLAAVAASGSSGGRI